MPEHIKFVSPEEIKDLAKDWQKQAKQNELSGNRRRQSAVSKRGVVYGYTAVRQEEQDNYFNGSGKEIFKLHGESFISEVIPRMIKALPEKQKLKIFDNGAGAGLFTDQIRRIFGNKVEVVSTGLSKQAAREYRKREGFPKLHPDDLKWRSIQELSDFPEFNLIIDTFGEQYYRSIKDGTFLEKNNSKEWFKHIQQVVQKLLPGGYASLAPVYCLQKDSFLKNIQEVYGVKARWASQTANCLKIEKPLVDTQIPKE